MNWYLEVLKKYAVFNGRARRKEYWVFTLANMIILIALMIIGDAVHPLRAIFALYVAAIFIPSFTVCVRRLHDTGRGAAWLLLSFVPIIGGIALLILTCLDSEPGENRFGPNPKGI